VSTSISLFLFACAILVSKTSITMFSPGPTLEDIAEEQEQPDEEEDEEIGYEDDMSDFIVDEDDVDEHGAVVR